MIINMTGGGGGASLNYKVVGGTTAPANPAENTIWVITDTEITSHIFSATEPESPLEGMVWLLVGTTCATPINLLQKGDAVYIYPSSCKQYLGGAWENINAKTYQQGTWIDWATYIFKSGEGCIIPFSFTAKDGNVSWSMTDERIEINTSSTEMQYQSSASTDDSIDLSACTTLILDAEITWAQTHSGYSGRFGIASSKINSSAFNSYLAYADFKTGGRQLLSLDISDAARSAVYVGWSRGFAGKIYNIYYL